MQTICCKHLHFKACVTDHVMYAGLGNTVTDIDVSGAKVFSKTLFSMVIPEVEQELEKEAERKSVVLFGIEVSSFLE